MLVPGSLLVLPANFVHVQQEFIGGFKVPADEGDPIIKDTRFRIDLVVKNLEFPTTFTFVSLDDILVLEKEKGTMKRIVGRETLEEPLINLNVASLNESPQLTWDYPVTPTGIKFLNSDRLGRQYTNDTFVGGSYSGKVYHFELNHQGNELSLNVVLQDHVAGSKDELDHSICRPSTILSK